MMQRLIILVILTVKLFGCEDEKGQVLFYSNYDKKGNLSQKDAYTQTYKNQGNGDYLLSIHGTENTTVKRSYQEQLKEKVVDSIGIYRFCNGKYVLTHRFDSLESERFCYTDPPFIHKEAYWLGQKRYRVNNQFYEVMRFGEMSSAHTGNTSYYLKNFGFICYYNDSGSYLLCSKASGSDINQEVLQAITNHLLNDSTFFMKYLIKKDSIKYLPPPA